MDNSTVQSESVEPSKSSRTLSQLLTDWRFYCLCLSIILIPPLVATYLWSPLGNVNIFQLAYATCMVGGLVALILPFAMMCAVICLLFPGIRKSSFYFLLLSLMILVSIGAGYFLSENVRRTSFVNMTRNSKGLIESIKAFERKRGHPPEQLEEITPDFIERIPGTGVAILPSYEYVAHAPENDTTWELRVPCPEGMLNYNLIFYWPSENYPGRIYGGYTERINNWAFVYEQCHNRSATDVLTPLKAPVSLDFAQLAMHIINHDDAATTLTFHFLPWRLLWIRPSVCAFNLFVWAAKPWSICL